MILAVILFAVGLAYFSYLGWFTRYWQDDYCYNVDIRKLGIIGALKGYTYITTYASNRLSLTFFSGLFYYLGVTGAQILPALVIVSWTLCIYAILRNLVRFNQWNMHPLLPVLLSLALIYFTVYLAPNRFQSIYWRTGMFTYTMPTIFACALFALFSVCLNHPQPSRFWVFILLSACLAFISAAFSEAACATLTAELALLILAAFIAKKSGHEWGKRLLPPAIAGLCFALLALVVLLLSPANEARQASAYPKGYASIPDAIILAIRFAWDFIYQSLRGLPIPHLVWISLLCMLGFMQWKPITLTSKLDHLVYLKWMLLPLLITFGLITAVHAPSALIEQAPPAERTFIITRFLLLGGLGISSWVFGSWLASALKSKAWQGLAAVVLLAALVYSGRSIILTVQYAQPRFEKIAAVWDERDQKIKREKAQGETVIHVRAIDSQYVGGVLELYPYANWVNLCAAEDYQVDKILATIPW